jgi:dipeptidyl aminopeptidase/acylaminoacyl peptidase
MRKSLLLCLAFSFAAAAAKRPLTQDDYDSWRHIQNQVLSNDGRYLAYGLFPQQGDGELVVRDLTTGKETRQAIGELPAPPPPNYSNPQTEETPPPPPGIAIKFTPDSQIVVASAFPSRAVVEEAKRQKRKPEEMPKGDLLIIQLASGQVTRVPRVKDFQLPVQSGNFVAYLQLPEKPVSPSSAAKSSDTSQASGPATKKPHKIETGDLFIRDLRDNSERKYSNVSEYLLSKDGAMLVYAIVAPDNPGNGVFALAPGEHADPVALLLGKGRYEKLAWDEDQTRLAFLSNHAEADAAHPRFTLYAWDRHSTAATPLVSSATTGVPSGWVLSDHSPITVAKRGERIFFGTRPALAPSKPIDASIPEDERVSVDLWSWKDDFIQPMQKIRAQTERTRSYRAVYDIKTAKFLQLAGPEMNELSASDDGAAAIGSDDRAYRRVQEYDTSYKDSYVVNTSTGERKLVARKHVGRITWSPSSDFAIFFDGTDWVTISTRDARTINLTSKLGVRFGNEQNDTPGYPEPYRLAGWTRDGRYVLIYDRYDIWRCSPDGSSAVNLTRGEGRRNHLSFRLVRFETDDPASRWIDGSKPLLLRAESDDTHDTGFFKANLSAAQAPEKLVWKQENFAIPIRAKNADVYVTAASTFSKYPDLLVTDARFEEFKKVSDANPQMAGFLWGTAELVHFDSTDGVPLKATLYKPENFDPKKKYPLIVYIYERLTQNVNNFIEPRPYNAINPSVYVSNGYLVLEPDIAYKIGYPGQSALNCVLPAIQAVVNQGFVNEHAIGIQGHSWGGYQIAYMITRTNRFRAAAAGAPVADMISAYDAIRWGPGIPRQFQYERTQSRIGGSVWEYPLRYIENSPIFMADRVNTPLLMIHNDADDAVPWYQGIEYYLALRRLDKEVYLFSYNGEPHNLRRRVNQKDYALRLQQFFDYYLKDCPEPDWMKKGIPYLDKPGAVVDDEER